LAVRAVWQYAPFGSSRRLAVRAVWQFAPFGSSRCLAVRAVWQSHPAFGRLRHSVSAVTVALSLMGAIDAGLTPIIEAQREYMGDVRRDAQTVIDMVQRQIDATAGRINPITFGTWPASARFTAQEARLDVAESAMRKAQRA
jgi:hypothetical protein